jgi:hypothetical protein
MRLAAMVVAVMVAVAIGGCVTAAEKKRVEREDKISASRISGKFRHDDPIVKMLSADEREALDRAGMMEARAEGDGELGEDFVDEDGDGEDDALSENKTGMDKAGDVMMSVLSVGVTLGMMAAPYLLF